MCIFSKEKEEEKEKKTRFERRRSGKKKEKVIICINLKARECAFFERGKRGETSGKTQGKREREFLTSQMWHIIIRRLNRGRREFCARNSVEGRSVGESASRFFIIYEKGGL